MPKAKEKLYILLVPDRVKYKVWHYDFGTSVFSLKKTVDIDLVVPDKDVEVLIPRLSESKHLVQVLLQDVYAPVIKLFDTKAVSRQLSLASTTAKQLIRQLATTPSLMLQSLLNHSEECSISVLLDLYWKDFCDDHKDPSRSGK
jgi:hypothetical protein